MPAGGGVGDPTIRLAAGKKLTVPIDVARDGMYVVTIRYDNHVHQLNTGITNAVKRVTVSRDNAKDPASAVLASMASARLARPAPLTPFHPSLCADARRPERAGAIGLPEYEQPCQQHDL